jgi:hypothetical protein
MAAMSILPMPSMACMARAAAARSGEPRQRTSAWGTTCHGTPKRSVSQPQRDSRPPSAVRADQSRSVSSWSAVRTAMEAASEWRYCGPPFSPW